MARGWNAWAAVLAAGLAASACGGSGGEAGGGAGDPSADHPLWNLFGNDESPAESRAKQLKVEELTAQCMGELGWEYTPVDYSSMMPSGDAADEDAALTPKQYGERYGYGIMHNYELYELPGMLGDGGSGIDGPATDGPGFTDPNADYVSSLSESEAQQYYQDLYGAGTDGVVPAEEDGDTSDPSTGTATVPAMGDAGCMGKASAEVWGDSPWSNEEFSQRMDELSQTLQDDASVKAAERTWRDCLTKAQPDIDAAGPDDVYQYFELRKAEAAGQKVTETDFDLQTGEPLDSSIDTGTSWSSWYDEDGHGFVVSGEPTALTEAQIATLKAKEMEVWTADQKCQVSSGYRDAQRTAEQKIVDQLRKEFPAIVTPTSTTAGG